MSNLVIRLPVVSVTHFGVETSVVFEFHSCVLYDGKEATATEPPQQAVFEYEKLCLASDMLSKDLSEFLDNELIERLEEQAALTMATPPSAPTPGAPS